MESSLTKAFRSSLAVLFVSVLTVTATAQLEYFVSMYGNFSIDLPKITTVTKGFRDDESKVKTAGMIYAWDTGKIVYTIRYSVVSGISKAKPAPGSRLEAENRAVTETVAQYKGEISSKETVSVSGSTGTEIKAKVGAGQLIARNVVIGVRAYSIQAIARDAKDFDEAVRRLDSFAIVDGRAILMKQIQDANVERLSKTDAVKRPSEARSENLHGPVSSITEQIEDLTGDASEQGPVLESQNTFNRRGLRLSRITFTQNGLPNSIYAFGFVGTARTATLTRVRPGKNEISTRTIKTLFDRQGRITRESAYEADGANIYRRNIRYSASQAVTTTVAGSITVRTTEKLNSKGDPIRSTSTLSSNPKETTRTRFKYERYDRFGNWTKRIVYQLSEDDGRRGWEPTAVQTRNIAYFN